MKQVLFLSFIVTLILFSCDKMEETVKTSNIGVLEDVVIDFYYKDGVGTDLLDPLNEIHYSKDELKLFNLIDGQVVEYYKTDVDGSSSNGLLFYYRDDINSYCVRILGHGGEGSAFNEIAENDKITSQGIAYLQLSDTDTDTIKYEIEKGKGTGLYYKIMKVWYNNELRWVRDPLGNQRLIEVIK